MKPSCRALLIFALLLAPAGLICQMVSPDSSEVISPDEETVSTHLVGKLPIIRMDFSKFPELANAGALPVEVLVDESGNVLSAEISELHERELANVPASKRELILQIVAQLHSAGMKLHFKSFEVSGKPARAKFEIEIPVRELEDRTKHVAFPEIRDWNSIRIKLSRSGCFGTCPGYELEVHGDGTVLYEGNRYVAVRGRHRAAIGRDLVEQIVAAFRSTDYFSLKDSYRWGATDLPTYSTSFEVDGRAKTVEDYAGQKVGMPESVTALETAIDHLSGVERWTKGNSDTAASLMREHFDFKSAEASDTLARVAQLGTAEAVRDLMAAGVAVSTKQGMSDRGLPSSALESAASRGDVEMIRALLDGIKDPEAKTAGLARAAAVGKIEAMRVLISAGANPIAPAVVVGAARSGVPAVTADVLKYKPDVNVRGENGETPLIACLGAYHYKESDVNLSEVVHLLLDAGADPNIADDKGMTPLILNARDLHIAEMLVARGANVNAQAKDGFTPLLNAEPVDLTEFLLKHGADPFAKDNQGETALDWAKKMGRKQQAALLEAAMTGKKL